MASQSYLKEEQQLAPKMEGLERGYFQIKRVRSRVAFIILVLPAVLWFLGLMIWPLFNMFYLSFFRWNSLLDQRSLSAWQIYPHVPGRGHF
jgi:hypothetical protein